MIIGRNLIFKKHFQQRIAKNSKLVIQTERRIGMFAENPSNPLLKNHPLTGAKKHLRAFSITGDIRIIYQPISENEVIFMDIGSHNQVY